MGGMTICRPLSLLLLLATALATSNAGAALRWHWDDEFSRTEQTQLTQWLEETHRALERYTGTLPFDVHLHLRRATRGNEPVPWANTWRGGEQSLFFYVNTDYPQQAFLDDWTAPHEFAHLIIPYVGGENAWFAEGFASYLQHSVMAELGVIDASEAQQRRGDRMDRAMDRLAGESTPLPENQRRLKAKRAYATFYWGGAVYFERVDSALRDHNSSLRRVLADYLDCCRMKRTSSLDALVSELDAVAGVSVFAAELAAMRATPGCPSRPQG